MTSMPTVDPATDPLRLLLIVASVRRQRTADALLPWVRAELEAHGGAVTDVLDLSELDPGDLAPADLGLGEASPVGDRLDAADAFVVLVPEYNHSYPGSLKNLIDWHSTQWAGKPVTFVSYGAGSGGLRAVEHLRVVFPELRAMTTRNVVSISAPWEHLVDGRFEPTEGHRGAMAATLAELAWWADALRTARRTHGAP